MLTRAEVQDIINHNRWAATNDGAPGSLVRLRAARTAEMAEDFLRLRTPRVALCGASGTGKTTVADRLSAVLGIHQNPVGSRSVAQAMGFETGYAAKDAGRYAEFQCRLLADKIAWEEAATSFISDRTTLDSVVYAEIEGHAYGEDDLRMAYVHARRVPTMTFLFLIERFHQIGTDPHRREGADYHRIYEHRLLFHLHASGTPHRAITGKDVEACCAEIVDALDPFPSRSI